MRRTEYLQNPKYKTKYRELYEEVEKEWQE